MVINEQPKLVKDVTGDWRTIYPKVTETFFEDFWTANEIMDSDPERAEEIFKRIIRECGDGHIDAILHLGFLFNDTGKRIEGEALIHKAHSIVMQIIPETFDVDNERISWSWLENRPLLRTFHAVGLELMNQRQYEKAIQKFDFVLKVNPGDNQGVRYSMIDCFFHLKQYEKFFSLDKLYPDDHSVEFMYGKLLAILKSDQGIEIAKKQFQIAVHAFPHVARELIKKKHSFPYDEFDRPLYGIPVGSRQEAFHYWNRTKEIWTGEKRILDFIRDNLKGR